MPPPTARRDCRIIFINQPLPRVARLIERRRLPWADMFRPCRATVGIDYQNRFAS
ncbi:MAG: hypothetical protein LBP75_05930 [Planctomycetota bacterium]|nr:hypothetical protein [Planctomycetota bacterium]